MTERRVAHVMDKAYRFGQVFVQAQYPRDRPADTRHLYRMGQTGAEMVPLVVDEYLCLVLQPAERTAVQDPVTVTLVDCSLQVFRLAVFPASGLTALLRVRRQRVTFDPFKLFPGHHNYPFIGKIVADILSAPDKWHSITTTDMH